MRHRHNRLFLVVTLIATAHTLNTTPLATTMIKSAPICSHLPYHTQSPKLSLTPVATAAIGLYATMALSLLPPATLTYALLLGTQRFLPLPLHFKKLLFISSFFNLAAAYDGL